MLKFSGIFCRWKFVCWLGMALLVGGPAWAGFTASNELESLVDMTAINLSINMAAFPNTPGARFWSSTPFARDPAFAWYVNFGGGDSDTQK